MIIPSRRRGLLATIAGAVLVGGAIAALTDSAVTTVAVVMFIEWCRSDLVDLAGAELARPWGPRPFVGWVLIEEKANGGDTLARIARENPRFLDGFSRVCEGAGLALYKRDDGRWLKGKDHQP